MPVDAEKVTYPKAGFWSKFVELNVKMWVTNKGLSADHPFGSRPMSWPLLSRGLGFWNGNHVPKTEQEHKRKKELEARQHIADPNYKPSERTPEEKEEEQRLRKLYESKFRSAQIYLLGNPLVWYASTISVALFIFFTLWNRLAEKRGTPITVLQQLYKGQSTAGFLFMAWVFHWVPFFAMQRQLFLHHYLPALYFAVLLFAVQVNHWFHAKRVPVKAQWAVCAIVFTLTALLFVMYAPITFGLKMTKSFCRRIKLNPRWDFDCDSLSETL
mgnify:FL=1